MLLDHNNVYLSWKLITQLLGDFIASGVITKKTSSSLKMTRNEVRLEMQLCEVKLELQLKVQLEVQFELELELKSKLEHSLLPTITYGCNKTIARMTQKFSF